MIEKLNNSDKQECHASLETIRILNNRFRKGESPWKEDTLLKIRSLSKPIIVDFNGVLVNQHRPWIPNPKAEPFLYDLVKLGTVLVITNAYGDWDLRQRALKEFGLWHECMTLLTFENCSLIKQTVEESTQRIQAIGEFTKLRNLSSSDWDYDMGKRVAPLFMKNFDIPIIDDDDCSVVSNNPGMLGIKVQDFTTDGEKLIHGTEGLPLEDALRIVEKHYKKIFFKTLTS